MPRGVIDSLAPGGRAFAVLGEGPAMSATLVSRTGTDALRSVELFETALAPLVNCERPSRFRF